MATENQSVHGIWASRWIFILAATGSAVGLGNIWKFPYMAGENGGGAFVLVYLFCILFCGIPIMLAEVMLGRRGRKSPVGAMHDLAVEAKATKFWYAVGFLGVLAGIFILSFYSVIAGWALKYVFIVGSGEFAGVAPDGLAGAVGARFDAVLADPVQLLIWHTIFMVMTLGVVARGVNRGIEKAIQVLMPSLFVLLLILLGFALSTGSFMEGVNFLFSFDASKLTGEGVLKAMGHSFFTLSLGMGAIMAYGAYMPQDASIGKTVLTVAFLDTLVALVAGMCIFPIVFANGLEPGAGPGLLFVTLPIAFAQMDMGLVFGVLFFVLVSIAAWSSSISLIEPAVAWAVEKGQSRLAATGVIGLVTYILGIGTVLSFNNWSGEEYQIGGMTFFDCLDWLTTNIMLPLGGVLIAIFAGWIMKDAKVRKELKMQSEPLYLLWRVAVRIVAPLCVMAIFLYSMGYFPF